MRVMPFITPLAWYRHPQMQITAAQVSTVFVDEAFSIVVANRSHHPPRNLNHLHAHRGNTICSGRYGQQSTATVAATNHGTRSIAVASGPK
ncbi:hypothetical protein MCOR25_008406 [Pyricularia grisea]|nr:hypothetical protein MCOR25_008406 [Pyricularia grisea]